MMLALGVFLVYLLTLCPSVPGGDSGMFIGAAAQLGVAHPPGYPLYTMLGHLATLLPWGSVAARVNMLSAVFDAAAVGVLFAVIRRLTGSRAAALAGAGMFAFSPLIWRYAVVAEVFALNNFFVVALLYLTLRFWQEPQERWAYAGAFVFGLGMSNHHTLVLIGLPLAGAILWRWRATLLSVRPLLSIIGLFALGLLPYVYLFWAGAHGAVISWGETGTLDGFLWHFLRKDFGTFQLGGKTGSTDFFGSNLRYLSAIFTESLILGAAVAGLGLWGAFKSKNGFVRASFLAFAFYILVFHMLANIPLDHPISREVHARFWQQAQVFVFLWVGVGFAMLLKKKSQQIAWVAAAVAVLCQLGFHYSSADQSWNTAFARFGRSVLESLPPRSLLVSQGDVYLNVLRYMQQIEGVRPDVMIVDTEFMRMRWFMSYRAQHLRDLALPLSANSSSREIYTVAVEDIARKFPGYEARPYGFLYKIIPQGSPFDLNTFLTDQDKALRTMMGPDVERAGLQPESAWEKGIWDSYWDSQIKATAYLFQIAQSRGGDRKIYEAIMGVLQRIQRENPRPPAAVASNMRIIEQLLKK
jgi:hypothetical protein